MNNVSVRQLAINDIIESGLFPVHNTKYSKKGLSVWNFSPSRLIDKCHTNLNRLLDLNKVNYIGNSNNKYKKVNDEQRRN